MGRTALIDADVLRYECSSVGQKLNKETGELEITSFDFVKDVFDERIKTILSGSGSGDFKLFLTADRRTMGIYSRAGRVYTPEYTPNFREAIAKGKVYKGTRKQDKPFHWINLTAYILSQPNVDIANGYEADDAIGMECYSNPQTTIVCTRDKDIRQIAGWHYGWECGKQPEFGPVEYDDIGKIELLRTKSGNKIVGGGWAFFCAQLLTGDVVDNIGGAKGFGPIKSYERLQNCSNKREYFDCVKSIYQENYGTQWEELLKEQCSLLWIIRERNSNGSLKHFNLEEWL